MKKIILGVFFGASLFSLVGCDEDLSGQIQEFIGGLDLETGSSSSSASASNVFSCVLNGGC